MTTHGTTEGTRQRATLTRPEGLTSAEVAERVSRGAVNQLTERTSRSIGEIVRANVLTRFNAILGALFVLVMVTGSFADGLFGIVLVVNSAIGIVQEYLAKRKLDRLALLNAPTTRVVRDGEVRVVPTTEVVQDDLIELRTGDEVPADGTLIASAGLELNEANLTGESDPVPHGEGDDIMSGTSVVAGSGRFHASQVGADAYVNRIAADARKFTRTRSEIQESINTLLTYITWVIVGALPIAIWSQWQTVGDQGWREVVIRSAAGVVGLVPEGLVLLTSVAFLLSAVQLTRRNVLVQQLPAVEGLARVDVVCLDKTGTLTAGEIVFERRAHPRRAGRRRDPLRPGRARRRPERQRHPDGGRRGRRSRRGGSARRRSRSTPRASGARPASPSTRRGCSVRPRCCSPPTRSRPPRR